LSRIESLSEANDTHLVTVKVDQTYCLGGYFTIEADFIDLVSP
jgi:hypothetical protein